MELWDELLLTWITILFALLIAKIASAAAAGRGRDPAKVAGDRSVELEDLGRRRERSEQVAVSEDVTGSESVGLGSDDVIVEEEMKSNEVKRSEVVVDESVKELDEVVEFGVRGEEQREDRRSQLVDLVIEEFVKDLDEADEFDLREEEHRAVGSQVVEPALAVEEFVKDLNATVVFDLTEEEQREERSQAVEPALGVEEFVKDLDDTVEFDLREEEQREERSQVVDRAAEEVVKELDETVECDAQEEEQREGRSPVVDLVTGEFVKEFDHPVKVDKDYTEIVQQLPEMKSSIHDELCEHDIGIEKSGACEKEGSLLCGEDEWEGIEKSELEKQFGVAMEYVGSQDGGDALSRLSSDVQKQLYGLHKVATEGPCYEPQPLALKVTARAKWY